MVPLLSALVQNGHEVTVATTASFVRVVERSGLRGVALGPDWTEPEIESVSPGFLGLQGGDQIRAFSEIADMLVEPLEEHVRNAGADILVHDHTEMAAWIVGERNGIPNVPFAMTARVLDPTLLSLAGLADSIDRLLTKWGLPPDGAGGRAGHWLYLDAIPFRLTQGLFPPPPSVQEIRFASDDRGGGPGLPNWLTKRDSERPLVYVTMGTIFNGRVDVLDSLVRGVARLGVDVLVTVGPNGAVDPDWPENVRVERYVPQSLLYPYLTAVVCHGGFNTVFGSLAHGIPVIVAPVSADQPLNAMLIAQIGAGLNLATAIPDGHLFPVLMPGQPTADAVEAAAGKLLSAPAFATQAEAFRDEMATQPDLSVGVAAIERLHATREPAHRLDRPDGQP